MTTIPLVASEFIAISTQVLPSEVNANPIGHVQIIELSLCVVHICEQTSPKKYK